MTEELLYRWSTAAQLVSVLMIALFYATLARSLQRVSVVWWAQAWWANLVALVVTASYWILTPPSGLATSLMRALYVGGKVAWAILLIQGAWALHDGSRQWLTGRARLAVIAGFTLSAILLLRSITLIGIAMQGTLGLLFIWCGIQLFRERAALTTWLSAGFIVRGTLALVEGIAYSATLFPPGTISPDGAERLSFFLGAHSSLDLASEWLLALGGVLALARQAQRENTVANDELVRVQDELRRMADRDPLTELANRRALPEAFRLAYQAGATLVFCDVDDFKGINDSLGHGVGDACLTRFAAELRHSFRPGDTIVRYAGDEFVVIANGMTLAMAEERVNAMRLRLAEPDDHTPAFSFSAGLSELAVGADGAAALKAADEAMYARKRLSL